MTSQAPPVGRMKTRKGVVVSQREIASFCRRFNIRLLAIVHEVDALSIGSRDWDMLVEFEAGIVPSRFELVAMEVELGGMAERRVDLRTLRELRSTTSRKLLDAAVPVFIA